MEMTRNKQKATLYTLQRRNETWNGNIVDDDEHKEKQKQKECKGERKQICCTSTMSKKGRSYYYGTLWCMCVRGYTKQEKRNIAD